ncbi:OmpP1/FadL family transporter [Apibacter adventoris]|uniref:Hemin receptor n=1 Tax=Apibacter adventoris TaxID=1679466 RepID=A0A2S8AG05_9FLAO|nr:outer membrane protein transport protein [Apibacter adventoris]PQL95042.1 hypothetical protein C4S77_02165 [Apibacter adventoris]
MNKKIVLFTALLAMFQYGKSQIFDPNSIYDGLNAYNGNFENSGTARYIGMGESMGALGGDISAVETNPAGLGIFRNSVANLTLGVLSNKNKATMKNSYSNTDTNFNFSNAGFVMAFGDESDRLKLNLGVNYSYQRLDNDVVFPYNENYVYTINNQEFDFNSYEQSVDGYKSKLKFSIATNFDDVIYFGLGLDWHYISMDRMDSYSDRLLSDNNLGYFYRQGTPYSQDANGFGLSVGVIGKVFPELRLGAAYHSPIWWSDIDTGYNYFTAEVSKDNVLNWDIYYGYYDKYKVTAPGKLVLSAAYASDIVNDDNSLAFNFDFINYFNKDYEFKGSPDYRLNNTFVDNYMHDSQEYRAGIEYRFKELKVRAGYAYMSSPVKDNTITGFNYETGTDSMVKNYMAGEKNKFSFGLGYDIGQFFADFAYQFIKTDYYTSFSGAYYNNKEIRNFGPGSEGPLSPIFDSVTFGKIKNTQNNFVLTLGMRF